MLLYVVLGLLAIFIIGFIAGVGKNRVFKNPGSMSDAHLERTIQLTRSIMDNSSVGTKSWSEAFAKFSAAVDEQARRLGISDKPVVFSKEDDQGDANAQFNLGVKYADGQGVPQDFVQAAAWFRKAADQGHANAQYFLGGMYLSGQGVAQDEVQAEAWLRKAAEQGNGHAQSIFGNKYLVGDGVSKDDVQAAAWFRKAAEQGDAHAQMSLGSMYSKGEGVPLDEALAAAWSHKAAEQGNAVAQLNLGVMYGLGKGVPQDFIQAHLWLSLAFAGFPAEDADKRILAADLRAKTATRMTPAQIAEAKRLARQWKPK